MAVHDFNERLSYSEKASEEPFWIAVYQKAFPNMVNCMPCPGDTESQRMGIDRVILLSNGKVIKIDEKKRSKDRDDILLEYLSNDVTDAPGWIEKDLAIDYLAYAFMQSQRCYLFPWPFLREAWREHGTEWKRKYPIPPALNNGYKTLNVAVPTKELYTAVFRAMRIDLPQK